MLDTCCCHKTWLKVNENARQLRETRVDGLQGLSADATRDFQSKSFKRADLNKESRKHSRQ